jgi:hypothetical protein
MLLKRIEIEFGEKAFLMVGAVERICNPWFASGWDVSLDGNIPRVFPCFRYVVGELHAE